MFLGLFGFGNFGPIRARNFMGDSDFGNVNGKFGN